MQGGGKGGKVGRVLPWNMLKWDGDTHFRIKMAPIHIHKPAVDARLRLFRLTVSRHRGHHPRKPFRRPVIGDAAPLPEGLHARPHHQWERTRLKTHAAGRTTPTVKGGAVGTAW
jgi:hypothetical protein